MFVLGMMSAAVALAAGDVLQEPAQGDVHLDGFVGRKIGRFLDRRVRGDFAKDEIFPEARRAFEKPDDDRFFLPGKGVEEELRTRHWGMWKGEFWGKLMISACRVAEYEHDDRLKAFLHEEALRLIALQRPDGYLGTYVDPEYVQPLGWAVNHTNTTVKGPWCWNLWCRKYTMWGLLANYRLTGEASVLEAMKRVQAMLAEHETNPCLSVGYNDQFANAAHLLNGATEPCDVIHWIRFNHDLWLLTGETKYVDAIELAFYNTYLAAMYRDGTWGAWNLLIGDRTVPVCDFGSAGDEYKAGGCQFSVWF